MEILVCTGGLVIHVLVVLGAQIHAALENGVSMYPRLEGRFPQVAGVTFGFDPNKPSGQRVSAEVIKVQGDYMESDKVRL